jgi:aspartate aminotransferase
MQYIIKPQSTAIWETLLEIALAQRVQRIKPSPTLSLSARVRELRAAGHDIIDLGAGEPDFDTPDHIKLAAIQAIQAGFTKYTAVDGIPALKKAVQDKFQRDNRLSYGLDQIIVSVGAKQAFYNLAQALLNPGDEVIIPSPYWTSYPDMVQLADGVPVVVAGSMRQGFRITPEQLEAAISPLTRLVVLNSPSNPTGAAYEPTELAALGEVLRRHPRVSIVSDDIYEHIWWGTSAFCNILNVCPDLSERTVVLNGVSKAYAMTGWRIGYAAGPKRVIEAMRNIQSQSTSNPTSIAQAAAQTALTGDQTVVRRMCQAFKERHEFVVQGLNRIPGVRCLPSQGTFYAFPNVEEVLAATGDEGNDLKLAERLIRDARIALVPGSAFGAPGYLRLSFATSMENLDTALARMSSALGRR